MTLNTTFSVVDAIDGVLHIYDSILECQINDPGVACGEVCVSPGKVIEVLWEFKANNGELGNQDNPMAI